MLLSFGLDFVFVYCLVELVLYFFSCHNPLDCEDTQISLGIVVTSEVVVIVANIIVVLRMLINIIVSLFLVFYILCLTFIIILITVSSLPVFNYYSASIILPMYCIFVCWLVRFIFINALYVYVDKDWLFYKMKNDG